MTRQTHGFSERPLRLAASVLAALAVACASSESSRAPASASQGPTHAIELLGGLRWLENLEPLEDTPAVAAQYDVSWRDPKANFRYGFELGISYASEEEDLADSGLGETDLKGTWWEYYAGLRSTVTDLAEWIRPYFSVGFSIADADYEVDAEEASETSYGAYARAGVYFPILEHLRVGIDYRHRFFDDLEFGQASAMLGLSF